jgi:phosphatidylglycerol---prolipoprotein diacylglyceryl transferase
MYFVINLDPVAFHLGPLAVHWYGLMYVVGIFMGLMVAWPYARSKGIASEQLERIVVFSIPAGLVGARLYYVIQQPLSPYLHQPWQIFAFWQGGMAFFGAIFAVVLVVIVLSRQMKMDTWKVLDTAVIFGVVGQFFGRIGNIINGDVIGYPTTLPWGVIYANPNSFPPRHDIAYQPAAAYEAISNVILFSFLWLMRKKVKPGMLFFFYIFGYSVGQIIVFIWRDNEIVLLGMKQAQLTSLAFILVAAAGFFWFLKRRERHQEQEPNLTGQGPSDIGGATPAG